MSALSDEEIERIRAYIRCQREVSVSDMAGRIHNCADHDEADVMVEAA